MKEDNKGKEKVIAAAFELFAIKGYTETSVDSIAAKAKVSKGLIYYYFKSKEAILKGIFASLMEVMEAAFRVRSDETPEAVLKNLIDVSFYFIIHKTKLSRLALSLTIQPEVTKGLAKEMEAARILWMGDLAKAFKALGYRDSEMEALQICALFDGIGLAYISMKDYPIQEIRLFIEKKYYAGFSTLQRC